MTGALPGHRRFADAVPAGSAFCYTIAGVTDPAQWETGIGTINSAGALVRGTVSASSAGGAPVDFGAGLKTVALTVGASWFSAVGAPPVMADIAGLNAALAGKQPLGSYAAQGHAHSIAVASAADGFMSGSDKAKLDGIAVGATVNASDAALRDRASHTGTQPHTSITGIGTLATQNAATVAITGGTIAGTAIDNCVIGAAGRASVSCTTINANGNVTLGDAAADAISIVGTASFSASAAFSAGTATLPAVTRSGDTDTGLFFPAANSVALTTGGAQRARIDANGVRVDGSIGIGTDAVAALPMHIRAPEIRLRLEPTNAGGRIFEIVNGGGGLVTAGFFAVHDLVSGANRLLVQQGAGEGMRIDGSNHILPGADNSQNLGSAIRRYATVFAGTGTINTSDAREKTWRGAMNDSERAAARAIIGELGWFQWRSARRRKGKDAARLHFGVRAQAVWRIMADHGLIDPIGADGRPGRTPYAFLCFDEWAAAKGRKRGHRFGLRHDQLALFLIAAALQP